LKVWSTIDYSLIQNIPAHLFAIYSIAFHPTLPYLATASRDKSIKIWDTENFELKKTISIEKGYDCHRLSINKIIWEPIDNQLISVSDDKLLKIWNVEFGG
jgi:centriolar protein POC1